MSLVWRSPGNLLKSMMSAHPLISVHHFTLLASDLATFCATYILRSIIDKPNMSLLERVDDALYVGITVSRCPSLLTLSDANISATLIGKYAPV